MKDKNNGHNEDPDVLVGNLDQGTQFGDAKEHWNEWKDAPSSNNITQIYHMPDIDDMAGILVRGNYLNQEQADALALLAAFAEEEDDDFTKKICRLTTSATIGVKGGGRLEALFGGIGIVASRMWEITKGFKSSGSKKNSDDQVYRRSDFRQEGPPRNGQSE